MAASAADLAGGVISLGEAKWVQLPKWAEPAVRRLVVPPSTLHPVVDTLPNGITLIVQTEDVSDTVSVYGRIRNSPEMEEPAGQEGITQVLDQLLPYGSERLDRLAFEHALDKIGARERAGTDFFVETVPDYFDRAVELLADNELHPALPEQQDHRKGQASRAWLPGQQSTFLAQHSLARRYLVSRSALAWSAETERLTLEAVRS